MILKERAFIEVEMRIRVIGVVLLFTLPLFGGRREWNAVASTPTPQCSNSITDQWNAEQPRWLSNKEIVFLASAVETALSIKEFPTVEVYSIFDDGSHFQCITNGGGIFSDAIPSPDGQAVVLLRPLLPPINIHHIPHALLVKRLDGSNSVSSVYFQYDLTDVFGARWSPDSTLITFLWYDSLHGTSRLYLAHSDGTTVTQLLQIKGSFVTAPEWSPDGQHIAIVLEGAARDALYTMKPNGSGLKHLADLDISAISWLDNDSLAVSAASGVLYRIRKDGLGLYPIAKNGPIVPIWSPDRKRMTFELTIDGYVGIYETQVDGSDTRPLFQRPGVEARNPAWSPDGNQIAFDANDQIYVVNADGTDLRRLTN